ncbi:MAG: hypothetical protein ACYTGN_07385 [Planctomycetota bacterium]|jgi:hypothetical protein
MSTSLKDKLHAHYAGKRLDDQKLGELAALARRRGGMLRLLPFAAAVVAVALVVYFNRGEDRTLAVAREIALNHSKELAVEYRADSCALIGERMDKLDFEIAEPPILAQRGWTLVGARYCSLQGRIAAQLRLTGSGGEVATLYEVKDSNEFAATRGTTGVEVDGVMIRIWRARGILFGLARRPSGRLTGTKLAPNRISAPAPR